MTGPVRLRCASGRPVSTVNPGQMLSGIVVSIIVDV